MKTTTVNVSELSGPALDWAAAQCLGEDFLPEVVYDGIGNEYPPNRYSTDWAQGGPVIEREEIGIKRNAPCSRGREWEASPSITAKGAGGKWGYGPTPLIAAMRCFVASKLGDSVEVPIELL